MEIVVHQIHLRDCEDPDLYVGIAVDTWQKTEAARWVMENATVVPRWERHMDTSQWYVWRYDIVADLRDEDISYFILRWT
jgi:hypothetical protein